MFFLISLLCTFYHNCVVFSIIGHKKTVFLHIEQKNSFKSVNNRQKCHFFAECKVITVISGRLNKRGIIIGLPIPLLTIISVPDLA